MKKIDVTFKSGSEILSGTLTCSMDQKSLPLVILVAGSGPVDRDENHKKLKINLLSSIASYFEKFNIATLRYDKRGVGHSTGDFLSTGFFDNIEDAKAAIDFIKDTSHVAPKHILMLGHSEGAIISAHIASQQHGLSGAILLAGTARSGMGILKWQLEKIAPGLSNWQKKLLRFLRIDLFKSQHKTLEKIQQSSQAKMRTKLFSTINAKWMREFIQYDPTPCLEKISIPILAITGDKDIQTPADDLAMMKKLIGHQVETHVISDLTHVMRRDTGKPAISHYKELISHPVDTEVLRLMVGWILKINGINTTA
tara:strand:- start:75090 stop:76022 length:933 start_codon:yes stop_codon:yes gene_type:complete